jgi:hypothetical protein
MKRQTAPGSVNCRARIETDVIDANVRVRLYATGFLPKFGSRKRRRKGSELEEA